MLVFFSMRRMSKNVFFNIINNTNTTYNNTLLSKLILLKILPILTIKKITITYPYTNFDTAALLINTNKRYLLLKKVLNYRETPCWCPCRWAPTPGGYLTKFNTGRLRPEVQPLTLSYTILAEKVSLLYTFY